MVALSSNNDIEHHQHRNRIRSAKEPSHAFQQEEKAFGNPKEYRHPNDLPRAKVYKPEAWQGQVSRLNPINEDGVWVFLDGDCYIRQSNNKTEWPIVKGDCPVCLVNRSTKTCARCKSVSYCSAECQKRHWKESHKTACAPNPKRYDIKLQMESLLALPTIYNEPHEFLLIKPTEGPLPSLEDICATVLESADHIMEIPGFGWDQLQVLWPFQNSSHPLQKKICDVFGWTSRVYGVELVEGYRVAEDVCVYMVLNDDSFTNVTASPGLANNYYGGSIYPNHVLEENPIRGNIVIFKSTAKNKRWQPKQQTSALNMLLQVGDDSDLRCEFELYPMSKLEIGLLLLERRKALDEGAFTRRMWRSKIRREERQIEMNSQMEGNDGPITINF